MLSKVTPTLETGLGYKLFLMFATINIGGMAVFSLCVALLFLRSGPFPHASADKGHAHQLAL